jgi:uncharacterized protein (DUF2267 family)
MDYEQFIASVEDAVEPTKEPATLRTLADRLSGMQTRRAVVRLAPELAPTPLPTGPVTHIDVDEYLPGIGDPKNLDRGIAHRNAEVVFETMLDVLGPEAFESVAIQRLDTELDTELGTELGTEAPPQRPMLSVVPLSVFFGRLAPPAQVTADTAQRFADAVVETLTERISAGAIDDLVERLPVELRPVLRHARDVYPGTGKHRRLQGLLDHVAERDDTCPALDAQPARPVLTLRAAAISEQDVLRLAVRLPRGYTVSWTRG